MISDGMRAGDICQKNLVTADEHDSIEDIAKLMRRNGVGDVVLTSLRDSVAVPNGIVTDRDIVVRAVACDVSLADLSAGDLQLRELVTIDADCDIFEVARSMNQNGVRRLIVTLGSRPIGIVTLDDVLLVIREIMNNLSATLERQIHQEKKVAEQYAGLAANHQ